MEYILIIFLETFFLEICNIIYKLTTTKGLEYVQLFWNKWKVYGNFKNYHDAIVIKSMYYRYKHNIYIKSKKASFYRKITYIWIVDF